MVFDNAQIRLDGKVADAGGGVVMLTFMFTESALVRQAYQELFDQLQRGELNFKLTGIVLDKGSA